MFNSNFFPTPKGVIEKMISSLNLGNEYKPMRILEPSAGKGDIVDVLNNINDSLLIDCIEIEPELQDILRGKGYNVVGEDFLNHHTYTIYDYIIMNPPFDDAVEHLLHIIDNYGDATVVCLLNTTNLDDLYSRKRKLLMKQLEDLQYERTDLGSVFTDAERTTLVEVSMIKFKLPKRSEELFKNSMYTANTPDTSEQSEDYSNNSLVQPNIVENSLYYYNQAKGEIMNVIKAVANLRTALAGCGASRVENDIIDKVRRFSADSINTSIDILRAACWDDLIENTSIKSKVTSSVRRSIEDQQNIQGKYEFSKANIYHFMDVLLNSSAHIMSKAIVEAFDHLTKYHKENREHIEGWKTNSAYRVRSKVVLFGSPKESESYWDSRYFVDNMNDLDKALCFLSGKRFEDIVSVGHLMLEKFGSMYRKPSDAYGVWHDTTFFEVKFFKKGTTHLKFKDADLLSRFNIKAVDNKNWLPEDIDN